MGFFFFCSILYFSPSRKGQEPECCPPGAASGPSCPPGAASGPGYPPGAASGLGPPVTNFHQRVACTSASLTRRPRRGLPTFRHADRHAGEAEACSPKFIINPHPYVRTRPSGSSLHPPLKFRSSSAPRAFACKTHPSRPDCPRRECSSCLLLLLDSGDSCAFDALLQLNTAKTVSELIKMVHALWPAVSLWMEKHFKKT